MLRIVRKEAERHVLVTSQGRTILSRVERGISEGNLCRERIEKEAVVSFHREVWSLKGQLSGSTGTGGFAGGRGRGP